MSFSWAAASSVMVFPPETFLVLIQLPQFKEDMNCPGVGGGNHAWTTAASAGTLCRWRIANQRTVPSLPALLTHDK